MSLATQSCRLEYTAESGQTTFPYPFRIFEATDLAVYQNASLLPPSLYSVSGVGEDAGGNVVLATGATAGDALILESQIPVTQDVTYTEGDAFPAASHERGLDRLARIGQQLRHALSRCLQVNVARSFGLSALELPHPATLTPVAGGKKYLSWNDAETNLTLREIAAADDAVGLLSSTVDSSTVAGLPAAGTAGRVRRLSDAYRGVAVDDGSAWQSLTHELFNVKFFGARGNGSADDTAAIQGAIDAAGGLSGGVVYFPPGRYVITEPLTIPYSCVTLMGAGAGRASGQLAASTLMAGAAMPNMVEFQNLSTLQHRGGVRCMQLDGFGLADWCLMVDGWRNLVIDSNVAIDALVGFMHTDFSGVSDFALSTISNNHASISQVTLAGGQGMSYFFQTATASGRSCDPITLAGNVHTSYGRGGNAASWSIDLNNANRCQILHHFAQPFETGTFDGGIWIHNASAGTGTGRNGNHLVLGFSSEYGAQNQPGILIDSDYTTDSSLKELNDTLIIAPRVQDGSSPVVKLDVSGATTTFLRRTTILRPRARLGTSLNKIVVNHANCLDSVIEARGTTAGALTAGITDNGTRTVINGLVKNSSLTLGAAPASTDLDVGDLLYDATSEFFWTKDLAGNIRQLDHNASQRSQGWVTSAATAPQLRSIPQNCYLFRAHLDVEEAFNGSGTLEITGGTTAGGTNLFAGVNVSTTGIKTVTLAGQAGFSSSSRAVHLAFTGTGASTGKAVVVLEWVRVTAQP